jgi:amino acid transporter
VIAFPVSHMQFEDEILHPARCATSLHSSILRKGEYPVSFALYIVGFLIAIGGVAWALITAGVRPLYVVITCVILLGLGIVSAVTHTRSKDSSKGPSV